jgi:DNA-binding transcriptional ArsR family regulator
MATVVSVFKAFSNPNRIRVFQIIWRRAMQGGPGITIDQICAKAGMKQPAVSSHVKILVSAGLVERKKLRWWVHCVPSRDGLSVLRRFVKDPTAFSTK